MKPLISVCIPTYNSIRFIHQCLDSVISQGIEDLEIIIVDNCSDDGTLETVRDRKDARIKLHQNEKNIGSAPNFNRTLERASAPLVKLLCSDDVLREGLLAEQYAVMTSSDRLALVSCDYQAVDDRGIRGRRFNCLPGVWEGNAAIARCAVRMKNHLGGPSNIMVRRNAIRFDASYRWVSDLKFAMEHLRTGDYYNVGSVGLDYRRHQNADSFSISERLRIEEKVRFQIELGQENLAYMAKLLLKREIGFSKIPSCYFSLKSLVNTRLWLIR